MTTKVRLNLIRTDGQTQNRAEVDNALIEEYAQALTEGAKLPPVLIYNDGVDNWLTDGFHRYWANKKIGSLEIECEVKQGTKREAQLASFGVNAAHGKRRTNADKRKAVSTMLADAEWGQWTDGAIAEACEVTRQYVQRVRSDLTCNQVASDKPTERTYTTKHGTQAVMKTGNIGQSRKRVDPIQEAIDNGEIDEHYAKDLWNKPEMAQRALLIQAKANYRDEKQYAESEGLTLDQLRASADEGMEEAEADYEMRMAEIANLALADDKLAAALDQIKDLNAVIKDKDRIIAGLEKRLSSAIEEVNVFKARARSMGKKLAAIDKAA